MKKEYGELMRKRRKEIRLTARELAERTGISLPFLALVERGGCEDISVGYATKIEEALDLPFGFFGERITKSEPQKDTHAGSADTEGEQK